MTLHRNSLGKFTNERRVIFNKNGVEYKICTNCKKEKPLKDFYNVKRNNTVTSKCKICTNENNKKYSHKYDEYYKEYRIINKNKISEKSKRIWKKQRQIWIEIISSKFILKCIKCGYDECFAALDFHHRNPKEKEYDIHKLLHLSPLKSKNIDKIFKELEKCDVLCSNCHREMHNKED